MGTREPVHSLCNEELARVFEDISRLLEVKGDSTFKIRAYHNAARIIAAHPEELRDMVARGADLRDIPGIGEAIAKKTMELLQSGSLEYFVKLRESVPPGVLELMQVPGIGPKTAGRLAGELGITSIEQLEAALRSGVVAKLPGMGEKTAKTLLHELELRRSTDAGNASGTL